MQPGADPQFFAPDAPALTDRYGGQFAVVCGRKLVGVHTSLELALRAAAEAFGRGAVEEGVPILINEIGNRPALRAVAEPR